MTKVYILHVTYWGETIEMEAFACNDKLAEHIEMSEEDWGMSYYDWNVITLDLII